jgi:hypothetical protein
MYIRSPKSNDGVRGGKSREAMADVDIEAADYWE